MHDGCDSRLDDRGDKLLRDRPGGVGEQDEPSRAKIFKPRQPRGKILVCVMQAIRKVMHSESWRGQIFDVPVLEYHFPPQLTDIKVNYVQVLYQIKVLAR